MIAELERVLAEGVARGERVAVATIVGGPEDGRRLLVWSAGETFGNLGWPHLNQRVALWAEQLLARAPAPTAKRFDVPGRGELEIRLDFPARD